MKINVLQCDSVPEHLQHIAGDFSDMFIRFLTLHNPQLHIDIYNVRAGEYPDIDDDCIGFVCTGSSYAVYDDDPWIDALKIYVRRLYQHEKKFVGICFGHQLIAEALGGQVQQAPQGWGLGVHTSHITQSMPWMNPPMEQFNLLVSHQDQVMQLPPDSEVLAANDHCPYFMFTVNSHFLGLQGHPEMSKALVYAYFESRREILGDEPVNRAIKSMALPLHADVVAHWVQSFLVR